MKKLISLLMLMMLGLGARDFTIGRIHYDGGGDWYCDPSSLPNLLSYLAQETGITTAEEEVAVRITAKDLHRYPYLYLTGHGNIRFSDEEVLLLREFLLRGAFLHVDDNYGLDDSFRREIKRVFPDRDLVEIPYDHPIFNCYFDFSAGLPKVHEHDNKPPRGLGIFDGERLLVFYTYESDLGDGWEDEQVHHDPLAIRQAALRMGVNIIWYALTQ